MNITNAKVCKIIAMKIKQGRALHNLTQEDVAETIGISIDMVRNIENARNVGSITTILKLCNLLEITPDDLFFEFIDVKPINYDVYLKNQFRRLSKNNRNALKDIIIYLDKNYTKP